MTTDRLDKLSCPSKDCVLRYNSQAELGNEDRKTDIIADKGFFFFIELFLAIVRWRRLQRVTDSQRSVHALPVLGKPFWRMMAV